MKFRQKLNKINDNNSTQTMLNTDNSLNLLFA